MKFSAVALFIPLLGDLIYFPIAHMVWYWADRTRSRMRSRRLPQRVTRRRRPRRRPSSMKSTPTPAGSSRRVRSTSRAAPWCTSTPASRVLVGALLIGKRTGYGKDLMAPHSLTMSMIGASLLWVGWFGFNAGSNLEANGGAALAMTNSFVATAAAALSWMFRGVDHQGPSFRARRHFGRGSRTCRGHARGRLFRSDGGDRARPRGRCGLLFFCTVIKNALGYDDSLDVFGVHCIGGIVGALGTGILVNPALGAAGIMDYTTGKIADYDFAAQMISQTWGVCTRWCGRASVRRSSTRSSMSSSACVPPSRWSAKVSTSPSTPNAPTTCNILSRGRDLTRSRPELRFGHIPGSARTVEGLQRKLEPLSLRRHLSGAAKGERPGPGRKQKGDCQSKPAGVEWR